MKDIYIADIRTGDDVQSFFMTKGFGVKIGGNKKPYLDLVLIDKTGDISAKQWDITDLEIESYKDISDGDIIKIRGNVTEWNGSRQVRITKLRKSKPNDNLIITDYVKAAPEKPEEMLDYVNSQVSSINDTDFKNLCEAFILRNKDKLLYYPAAAKNHHAELGGLLYHIKRMLQSGIALCAIYQHLNKDLLITGVIMHDMEKLNEIEANELGVATGYSFEGQMLGHLVQGVKLIDNLGRELDMPYEKMIMLEHMMISHHYEPDFGSPKKPLFPEAELLHYLDMIDAKMYDMEEALQITKPGEFSEKIWTLDNRRIYKPSDR